MKKIYILLSLLATFAFCSANIQPLNCGGCATEKKECDKKRECSDSKKCDKKKKCSDSKKCDKKKDCCGSEECKKDKEA